MVHLAGAVLTPDFRVVYVFYHTVPAAALAGVRIIVRVLVIHHILAVASIADRIRIVRFEYVFALETQLRRTRRCSE